MRNLNKQEMAEWRNNTTTQEFLRRIHERALEAADILVTDPGANPVWDARLGGMIKAYREVLDFTHDPIETED